MNFTRFLVGVLVLLIGLALFAVMFLQLLGWVNPLVTKTALCLSLFAAVGGYFFPRRKKMEK